MSSVYSPIPYSQGWRKAIEDSVPTAKQLTSYWNPFSTASKRRRQDDTWEAMLPYNQAIARSAALGQTSETSQERAHLSLLNRMRLKQFKMWHK